MMKIKVEIDKIKYEIEKDTISGSELKTLAGIPLDKALVQEVGDAPDIDIENNTIVHLDRNMVFISELLKQQVDVVLDGTKKTISKSTLSGIEIKVQLGVTSDEYKLIREVKDGMDIVIMDDVIYEVRDKDEFFTMPIGINNGGQLNGVTA